MAEILLEVCVDDAAGLATAIAGGADRIELCGALPIGGITPSPGLMELAAASGKPAFPMIRSRAGDFVFGPADVAVMKGDIRRVRAAGLPGVVIGANLAGGGLDWGVIEDLAGECAGLEMTLHRCIDLIPDEDVEEAVERAVALGFRRILSSGGALKAPDGVARLATMFRAAAGRLIILPGSGLSAETLPALAGLPLREAHGSCSVPMEPDARGRAFGFQAPGANRTDQARVRAMKDALQRLFGG